MILNKLSIIFSFMLSCIITKFYLICQYCIPFMLFLANVLDFYVVCKLCAELELTIICLDCIISLLNGVVRENVQGESSDFKEKLRRS